MKRMNIIYFGLIFIALLNHRNVFAQETSPDTWTKYCGWHYGAVKPDWGGWVREYAKDQFGRFIIDSTNNQLDLSALNNAFDLLNSLDSNVDIMQGDGGLASARDTTEVVKFMNMIESDSGKSWRNNVFIQTMKMTQLKNSKERFYWQVGNEISSPAYSKTIRFWKNNEIINGYNYDKFIIQYYVENYLAPTIEGIDSASFQVFNEKGMINICLGSITNAHNPNAIAFADSLLNYEIIGTNAPTLSGKKVYELIHIITIHYAMGTSTSENWENNINQYSEWFGKGRVCGVWSTEEVGIKAAIGNLGGFAGSIATARYLEWSIKNNYSARIARTNYYGWNNGANGSSVKAFNDSIYSFINDSKLFSISSNDFYFNSDNLETHSFLTEDKTNGIAIAFNKRVESQSQSSTISEIIINKENLGEIDSFEVYKYGESGFNKIDAFLDNYNKIIFKDNVELDYYSGIIVHFKIKKSTSIKEEVYTFNISPNPASEYIEINLDAINPTLKRGVDDLEEVKIYNTYGELVMNVRAIHELLLQRIDISHLPVGIYFIQIGSFSEKFAVVR